MDNKVESPKKSTSQQPPSLRPEDNLPPEQPTKISWFRWFVQKIIAGVKWIKDLITFNHGTKIATREIAESYIESIEKKELSNIEFEKMVKQGTFSDEVFYTVNGNVTLKNIKKLPQHVKILGDCIIKSSSELKKLSYDFIVAGNVDLSKCSSLEINTDDNLGTFDIQGSLVVNNCNSFNFINSEKKVSGIQGSITINSCDSFSYLPSGINNDVNIINCKRFEELLAGNYNNLEIKDCKNFSKIHPNIVAENLILNNNKKFTSFADNLIVKNLSITSCPIKSFTNKITISQDLLIESCDSLEKIQSSNVKVNRHAIIKKCKKLKLYSEIEHFARLARYQDKNNFPFFPYIDEDLPERDKKHLLAFLKKIKSTQDYKRGNQEFLGKQVIKILSLFQKETNPSIRAAALEIVEESVSTCVDRTILALDDLLILALQQEAQKSGDPEKMRAIAKHSIIIGLSDSIAREYPGLQIENVLKARIIIRKKFGISPLAQSMAFGPQADFKNFYNREINEIRGISNNPANITKFIESGKSSWDEFQKTNIVLPKFAELPIEPIDKKEMPECCITNTVYDEMVEYRGGYYGYETLLTIYRNKQKITDKSELVDPSDIRRVVLKKDDNT